MPDIPEEGGAEEIERSYGIGSLAEEVSKTLMAGLTTLLLFGCASIGGKNYRPDIEPPKNVRLLKGSEEKSLEEKEEALEERYDFELITQREDYFQDKPESLSIIAEVLHKEYTEKEFDVNNIVIRDGFYMRTTSAGAYDRNGRYKDSIIIRESDNGFREDTFHHEIIHAKHEEIVNLDLKFNDKWVDLVEYNGQKVPYNERGAENHLSKGFATKYSSTNIMEDIAEHGEGAEARPDRLYSIAKQVDATMKRIKRLDDPEVNLIPVNFLDYQRLEELHEDIDAGLRTEEAKKYFKEFMEESESFLPPNEDERYEAYVRNLRGEALKYMAERLENENMLERAVNEFRKGLQADLKAPEPYKDSLQHLAEIHASVGNKSASSLYKRALEIYEERHDSGSVSLTTKGVVNFKPN